MSEQIERPSTTEAPAAGRQKRNRPTWALAVAGLAAGLVLGGASGAAIALGASDPTASQEYRALEEQLETAQGDITAAERQAEEAADRARVASNELAARSDELDQREQAVASREAAVTAVEQQIAANSIKNGIWTVGVDVAPGTYRTSEALTGYCYWAIYESGTSGGDIIENDGPTGGFPTVTLSAGQDFENSGCGTFVKQ
jgi:hypothetical protein